MLLGGSPRALLALQAEAVHQEEGGDRASALTRSARRAGSWRNGAARCPTRARWSGGSGTSGSPSGRRLSRGRRI